MQRLYVTVIITGGKTTLFLSDRSLQKLFANISPHLDILTSRNLRLWYMRTLHLPHLIWRTLGSTYSWLVGAWNNLGGGLLEQVETNFFVGSNFTDAHGKWLSKPNAALYISKPGPRANTDIIVIVTLSKPAYDAANGTLSYKVRLYAQGRGNVRFERLKDETPLALLLLLICGNDSIFRVDHWISTINARPVAPAFAALRALVGLLQGSNTRALC